MKILISFLLLFYGCQRNQIATKSVEGNNTISNIKWDVKTIDFGNVSQDTIIKGCFNLYNQDTLPLLIYYVNPECNCTDFSVSSYLINPQDSSQIVLHLNTEGKHGYQRIITTVCTNSRQRFFKLTLKGYID